MDETSWTTVRYNIITQHLLGFAEGGQRSALPPPPSTPRGDTEISDLIAPKICCTYR